MKKILLIVFLLLAIPQVARSDGFVASNKVIITPETTYCTADCVTRTEVFTKDEVSISCEVAYCRDEACVLKPSNVSNCQLVK